MSEKTKRTLGALTALLAAAALAPASSVAQQGSASPPSASGLSERTPTELGQAVGEPGEAGSAAINARYGRTPTELAQRTWPSVAAAGPSIAAQSRGFAWGDAAIGAAAMLGVGLLAAAGTVLYTRRRRSLGATGVGVASS